MTDSKPIVGQARAGHGREPGHRRGDRRSARRGGRARDPRCSDRLALEEIEDRIHQAGGSATIAPLDLTDGDSIGKLAVAVAERWGKLDILVLNAAMLGSLTPVQDIDPKEYSRLLSLNVLAPGADRGLRSAAQEVGTS